MGGGALFRFVKKRTWAEDEGLPEQVAKVLKVPAEAIKNFDEEVAVNMISNTFNDHAIGYVKSYTPAFNPIDKIVELYEAFVKSEMEKVETLQRLLDERK